MQEEQDKKLDSMLIAQKMLTLTPLGTIVATDCRFMSDLPMISLCAGQMKITLLNHIDATSIHGPHVGGETIPKY